MSGAAVPASGRGAVSLPEALAIQARLWPEPRVDQGLLEAGWTTAAALFADDDAVEDWLDYEATYVPGLDRKGRAAALITDYSYMFAASTVPLLVGCRLVPDLSPANYALRFEIGPVEHDGEVFLQRRMQVRFLNAACRTDRGRLRERSELQAHFRHEVEAHFQPFIETLHGKSRLPRNAFWRLVADSLAALFLDAGQRFARKAEALAEAAAILKVEGSPLNNRQLHYFDIALSAADDPGRILLSRTFRSRGGCCRYYTADPARLCTTCVLKDPAERDRGIVEAMCRRLGLSAADTSFTSQIQTG
jgi:hypothetical protein